MRTHISSGVTITYPDNFCLSGNRNIVKIEGATAYDTFTLFGDTRDLIDGYGEFNLKPYFEALFSNDAKNEKFSYKSLSEELLLDSFATVELAFEQIYFGKNVMFENRSILKYNEYSAIAPFFDFWLEADMNGEINGVASSFYAGMNSIDLSSYSGDVVVSFSTSNDSTFYDTFGYTFTSVITNPIIIQEVLCPENGITLRYIDSWGVWQQKNFNILNKNKAASSETYNWNDQPSDILYDGLQYSSKTKSHSIDIQSNVRREEANKLAYLCQTEAVHVYDNATAEWLPINIATSSVKIPQNKPNTTLNFNIILQNED